MNEEIKTVRLNPNLVRNQGLNQRQVDLIAQKHQELDQLIDMINGLEWNEENKQQILQLTKSVELYEFQLQKLWGFEQDRNFHTHWVRIEHCSCRTMDNMERLGLGVGYYRYGNCKIHGEENAPDIWKNLKGRDSK